MREHFDRLLNVKELILAYKPLTILEVGAAMGGNTIKLLRLQHDFPFKLVTISDNDIEDSFCEVRNAHGNGDYRWNKGISYELIPKLIDGTVNMAIMDTDHNYWTLKKELDAIYPKMNKICLIVFHDTYINAYNDGLTDNDNCTDIHLRKTGEGCSPYPREEIMASEKKGLVPAILDFMGEHPEFYILRYTLESNGAMCIARGHKPI